jgi:hypothetical protein
VRIGDCDSLFFERQRTQVATACASIVRALALWLAIARGCLVRLALVVGDAERACKRVELAHLLRVLQLELLCVMCALGLGNEQPALERSSS